MEFKVGMEVLYTTGYNQKLITTIIAITPKGFVKIASGTLFNPNGRERTSDPWRSGEIREATQRDFDNFEKAKLIKEIKDFDWRKLDLDKLRELNQLITLTNVALALKEATKGDT